jgi:Zn-finger nucleic acid-binding protein
MPNRCPACAAPLVAFELDGVEVDHCVACKGTWLDEGELEQIALMAGAPSGGLLMENVHGGAGAVAAGRRCPRCGRALHVVTAGGGVKLDRCPRGDGLWLDAGELAALLARSGDAAADEAVKAFLSGLLRHELTPEGRKTP